MGEKWRAQAEGGGVASTISLQRTASNGCYLQSSCLLLPQLLSAASLSSWTNPVDPVDAYHMG